MILSAQRFLRGLSGYHYRTIALTVLLPAIGPNFIVWFGPDLLVLQVILHVAAFFVWSAIAVLAVASMLSRDRSEAEHQVIQRIDALSGQIVDDQDLYTIVIRTYIPPRQVGDGPWTPWYADYYHR